MKATLTKQQKERRARLEEQLPELEKVEGALSSLYYALPPGRGGADDYDDQVLELNARTQNIIKGIRCELGGDGR